MARSNIAQKEVLLRQYKRLQETGLAEKIIIKTPIKEYPIKNKAIIDKTIGFLINELQKDEEETS